MVDSFVNQTNGVKVGTNNANFGECVGLVQKWFQTVGAPFFYGNAKDLYNNAPSDSYNKGTSWPAPEGAATVLDSSWGNGAGHTQLSLGNGKVFEQNNPYGSAPHVSNQTSKPNGWIGWIQPKNYNGGDDEMAWKETAEKLQAIATQTEHERDDWKATAEKLQAIATQNEKERDDWKAAAEKVQAIATQLQNEVNSDEAKKKLEQIKQIVG